MQQKERCLFLFCPFFPILSPSLVSPFVRSAFALMNGKYLSACVQRRRRPTLIPFSLLPGRLPAHSLSLSPLFSPRVKGHRLSHGMSFPFSLPPSGSDSGELTFPRKKRKKRRTGQENNTCRVVVSVPFFCEKREKNPPNFAHFFQEADVMMVFAHALSRPPPPKARQVKQTFPRDELFCEHLLFVVKLGRASERLSIITHPLLR